MSDSGVVVRKTSMIKRILGLYPAPSMSPRVIVSVWSDAKGWIVAWAEPVVYTALVSWTYEDGTDNQELEVVAWDISVESFQPMSEWRATALSGEVVSVLDAVPTWEELVRLCQKAQQCLATNERERLEKMLNI